jgi:hypothetical protein
MMRGVRWWLIYRRGMRYVVGVVDMGFTWILL